MKNESCVERKPDGNVQNRLCISNWKHGKAVIDSANCKQNALVYITVNDFKASTGEANTHMFIVRTKM